MRIEIINTGSELLLGRVLNTHQQWICQQCADRGFDVQRQVAVPDTGAEIVAALREALARSDFIIVTGGLGPTSDDLTRDQIAIFLGQKLREDATVLAQIEEFFQQRRRPMPASTRVQALVPDGAIVLPNANGTAPGLVIELSAALRTSLSSRGVVSASPEARSPGTIPGSEMSSACIVMLPGPPRELRPMFATHVLPLLQARAGIRAAVTSLTLKTTGLGESLVEEKIQGALQELVARGLEIGYCARVGEVDVRLLARGPDGPSLVKAGEEIVRPILEKHLFGEGDETLEGAVVRLLRDRGATLALAESCTGGYLAHRVTNVPGASEVFVCGWVTYSNAAKVSCLEVRAETLEAFGAVSDRVAREMAEGARARTGANYALAVTGIAGPAGGTPQKPVGTVFIALAMADGTRVINSLNPFDRETFKNVTSQQALNLLRRAILREPTLE